MWSIVTVNRLLSSLHWMVMSVKNLSIDSLSADEQPANEENLMQSPKSPLRLKKTIRFFCQPCWSGCVINFNAIESMFSSSTLAKYAYVYNLWHCHSHLLKNTSILSLLHGNIQQMFCSGGHEKVAVHCNRVWQKRYIHVTSLGGDGDSRLMKSMRLSTSISTAI